MGEQLPLFNLFRAGVDFDNFWPGENQEIVELIKAQLAHPGEPCVYLWGHYGVGKSHLLQAACGHARKMNKNAAYLPLVDLKTLSEGILEGLEQYSVICIDDVDVVAQQSQWETALFHLFNHARENGAVIIFSGNKKPAELELGLLDLKSRLGWGVVWQVKELNDADKVRALQLRADRRGFNLPAEVGAYLIQRCPRDMHSLFALLEKLDQASLSKQRKLTIPFVRQFIR